MPRRTPKPAAPGDASGDSCPRRLTNTPDRLRLFPAARGAAGGLGIRRAHLRLFPRTARSRCLGNARRRDGSDGVSGVGGRGRRAAGEGLPSSLGLGSGETAQRAGPPSRGLPGHLRPETGPRPSGSGPGRRELGAASEVSARGQTPRAPSGPGVAREGRLAAPAGTGGESGRPCSRTVGGDPSRRRPAAVTLHRRERERGGGAPAGWPSLPAPLLSASPAALLPAAPLLSAGPPAPPLSRPPPHPSSQPCAPQPLIPQPECLPRAPQLTLVALKTGLGRRGLEQIS